METQKFYVYNQTRESSLGLEVGVIDTTVEPLKKLISCLSAQLQTGLWLKPYRGIPHVPGQPSFDLVCLDEDYRVVEAARSLSTADLMALSAEAVSALVLPAQTILSSQTRPGDQLAISPNEQVEQGQQHPASLGNSIPFATSAEFVANGFARNGSFTSVPANGHHLHARPATSSLLNTDSAETEPASQGSLRSRFLRMFARDRREARRHPIPDLVAYDWTSMVPEAHLIANISDTGLYLLTPDRQLHGTRMLMRLQRSGSDGDSPTDSISVATTVVRWGSDGQGFAFVQSGLVNPNEHLRESVATRKDLKKFLQQLRQSEQERQLL